MGEEDSGSLFGGTVKDAFSTWIDIWKQDRQADIQTRVLRAQGEQDALLRSVERQYGGGMNPLDIRNQLPATSNFTVPTWAIYLVLGALVVGGGALLVRSVAKG